MKRSRLALSVWVAALCVVAATGLYLNGAQVRAAAGAEQASVPLVGVWIDRGKGGLGHDLDQIRLLDLRANGEFQWTVEDMAGKPKDTSLKGTYTATSSTLTFNYKGERPQTETRKFAIKGRVLVLETGDSYNWNSTYLYRRDLVVKKAAIPAQQAEVLGFLKAQLALAGSVVTEVKDFEDYNSRGTYARWTVDLTLTNRLPFDIGLGNAIVVAQLPEEGPPTGFVRIRGEQPVSGAPTSPENPSKSYLLADFDTTNGGRTMAFGGAHFMVGAKGKHPLYSGFGFVPARSKYVFFEEVSPNEWLKNASGMQVVLPELLVRTAEGVKGYFAIVSFEKRDQQERRAEWVFKEVEIVPARVDVLRTMIDSPSSTLFRKILAVNWLVMTDPARAGEALAKVLDRKTEGYLLAAGLNCYQQYGLPGFEKQATALEFSEDSPLGIQQLATAYLDARKADRGVMVLATSGAAQPEDGRSQAEPDILSGAWAAVQIAAPRDMLLRRIKADGVVASDEGAVLAGDSNGLPGAVLAKLAGADGDYRGKVELRNGKTYWFALRGTESRFTNSWKKGPAENAFPRHARSSDGGKTWQLSDDKAALRTTIWYTAP